MSLGEEIISTIRIHPDSDSDTDRPCGICHLAIWPTYPYKKLMDAWSYRSEVAHPSCLEAKYHADPLPWVAVNSENT